MPVKGPRAFLAGMIGAIMMTLMGAAVRASDVPMNLEMMLGTIFGAEPSPTSWGAGFVIHLVAGGVFGLLYGELFEFMMHRSGAGVGLSIGFVHTLISGVALGIVPAIHPLVPEHIAAPGIFMASLGSTGVMTFLALHLVNGAIVGTLYGPVRHPIPDGAFGIGRRDSVIE